MNRDLKHAIQSTGRKQYFVAQQAGMSDVRLSRIINGHAEPTPGEQKALAKILQRPVAALFPLEARAS